MQCMSRRVNVFTSRAEILDIKDLPGQIQKNVLLMCNSSVMYSVTVNVLSSVTLSMILLDPDTTIVMQYCVWLCAVVPISSPIHGWITF